MQREQEIDALKIKNDIQEEFFDNDEPGPDVTDEELKAMRFNYIDQQIEEEKSKIVKASEDKDVPKAEEAEQEGQVQKQDQQQVDDVYDYTQNTY